MCQLACEQTSDWLMVDPWEATQEEYQLTAVVLDHISSTINGQLGGIATSPLSGALKKPVQVALLGGSDLLQTMTQPGVWTFEDLDYIFGSHGVFIIERSGSNVSDALAPLNEWSEQKGKSWVENIQVVRQLIANDISSTRIRQFLKWGMSVQYLLPSCVIEYLREHQLYRDQVEDIHPLGDGNGKAKGKSVEGSISAESGGTSRA